MARLVCTLFSTIFVSFSLCAQQNWEVGLGLGTSFYNGDLSPESAAMPTDFKEINPAYTFLFRHHAGNFFTLRANITASKISGNDYNFTKNKARMDRGFRFESPISEASVLIEWDILGHKRRNKRLRQVSPYVFGGIGLITTDPAVYFNEEEHSDIMPLIEADKANRSTDLLNSIPVGLGLKYRLRKRLLLSLEANARVPITDYLDGISETVNPSTRDWFVTSTINISYQFGKVDTDGDGIRDEKDKCPNDFGMSRTRGCPDLDRDGVADNRDDCPHTPGSRRMNGCPDADNDGILDENDLCPNVSGVAEHGGCPDTDMDGITDAKDDCPQSAGIAAFNGCPDSDGDGISDLKDNCPTDFGLAANGGCPDFDTDDDGVVDSLDICPRLAGLPSLKGCPDSDGDGVMDLADKCADTPGSFTNFGCPSLSENTNNFLKLAMHTLQFKSNSALIRNESLYVLDHIAAILQKYPHYHLRIKGYTDDRGNDAVNQQLSEMRAGACQSYLRSKGISPLRVRAMGYGETSPIADNNTVEGRLKNRRVEFELYIK